MNLYGAGNYSAITFGAATPIQPAPLTPTALITIPQTPMLIVGNVATVSVMTQPLAGAAWTVTAGALPTGMTNVAGAIHGTPTQAGLYAFTLTSSAASSALQLIVNATAPHVTITANPSFVWLEKNQSALTNLNLAHSGGSSSSFTASISAGSLPPGMYLYTPADETNLAQIAGTPTAEGLYIATVQSSGNMGDTGYQILTLAVLNSQRSPILALPPALANVPYSIQLDQAMPNATKQLSNPAATGPYFYWQSFFNALPAWASITESGLLQGTPGTGDGSDNGTIPGTLQLALENDGFGPTVNLFLAVLETPPTPPVPGGSIFGTHVGFAKAGKFGGGTK